MELIFISPLPIAYHSVLQITCFTCLLSLITILIHCQNEIQFMCQHVGFCCELLPTQVRIFYYLFYHCHHGNNDTDNNNKPHSLFHTSLTGSHNSTVHTDKELTVLPRTFKLHVMINYYCFRKYTAGGRSSGFKLPCNLHNFMQFVQDNIPCGQYQWYYIGSVQFPYSYRLFFQVCILLQFLSDSAVKVVMVWNLLLLLIILLLHLCRVFTIADLNKTMFLGYIILQPFCGNNLRYM